MHVALERHHDFLRGEGVHGLHALNRLAGVEFRIALRQRVNVVQRRIAVDDVEFLADADAEHVRMVAAAFLIDGDGTGRRVVGVVAEAVLDVDEHVGELAVRHFVGFLGLRRRVGLHADRIGVHLDRFVLRRDAVEGDHTVDVARRRRVDLGAARCRTTSLRRVEIIFLPAARDDRRRERQTQNAHPHASCTH